MVDLTCNFHSAIISVVQWSVAVLMDDKEYKEVFAGEYEQWANSYKDSILIGRWYEFLFLLGYLPGFEAAPTIYHNY